MILAVNIWGGDKMGADIENEINKKRWERWRAKQKAEREKTCFYCWGQWSNWGEAICNCEGEDEIGMVKEVYEFNYKEYYYSITPKKMVVEEDKTRNVYLTAHSGNEDNQWIEIGAQRALDGGPPWPPKMFSYVSIEDPPFKTHDDWDWGEKRRFRLRVDPDTGDYAVEQEIEGKWRAWRSSEKSGLRMSAKPCNADMAEEFFSEVTYIYSEFGKSSTDDRDLVTEASLKTKDDVKKDFDDVSYDIWSAPSLCAWMMHCEDIENGFRTWVWCELHPPPPCD